MVSRWLVEDKIPLAGLCQSHSTVKLLKLMLPEITVRLMDESLSRWENDAGGKKKKKRQPANLLPSPDTPGISTIFTPQQQGEDTITICFERLVETRLVETRSGLFSNASEAMEEGAVVDDSVEEDHHSLGVYEGSSSGVHKYYQPQKCSRRIMAVDDSEDEPAKYNSQLYSSLVNIFLKSSFSCFSGE